MSGIVEGMKAVAEAIGVFDKRTVMSYAARRFDPIPLRLRGAIVVVRSDRLDLWKKRNEARKNRRRDATIQYVEGMEKIAALVGVSLKTATRMVARSRNPLPVERTHRRRWAYVSALQDWVDREEVPYIEWRRRKTCGSTSATSPTPTGIGTSERKR